MNYKYYYDSLKNKKFPILLFLIVVVGFLLRLYRLGGPGLWYDELMTAGRLDYSLYQIIHRLRHIFVTPFPPTYYIMMKLWVNIFGNSEFSLRFPSLIFSVLSIIFIFKLSKELFDEKVGIFAALFLSISPFSIYYAQEAKMYSMIWFFGILSFLFFFKFIKDNKFGSLLSYVIFTAISIYIIYIGFIFIVIHNILFFTIFHAKQFKKWLLGQLMIILLYLPWIDKFLYDIIYRKGTNWIREVNYSQLLPSIFTRTLTGQIEPNISIELTIYCFLIISAIVNFKNIKKKKNLLSFTNKDYSLIVWVMTPIVIYLLINTLVCQILIHSTIRYLGSIHVPLIILISKGLNKYHIKFKSVLLIALLIMTFLYRLYPLYQFNYRKLHPSDWRSLSNQLHQRADSNSLILTKEYFPIVTYYNRDYQIKSLNFIEELEKNSMDKNIDSFFIVYRYKNSIEKLLQRGIKGYKLEEDYYEFPNGFLWFKK